MDGDWPEFGVDFDKGEITRPAPENAPAVDETFNAFDDDDQQQPQQQPPQAGASPQAPEGGTRVPEGQGGKPDFIPAYRYDELNNRFQQQEQRVNRLMELLVERLGPQAAPQPASEPPKPLTPQEQARERIRQQFFEVVPEFKEFLEFRSLVPQLREAAQAIPTLKDDANRYWGNVADSALNNVHTVLGEHLGQQIDPKSRIGRVAAQMFFEYVASDPNLVRRYEAQDPKLLPEFMQVFDRDVLAPARTRQVAQQRIETTRRLPVAGRSSPPPSAPTPKPDDQDEDAPFKRAWDGILNARQAMTP